MRSAPTNCMDGRLRARTMSSTSSQPSSRMPVDVQPAQDVVAAVAAGQPHVLAGRERHRPAGAVDLLGDLRAAGRGADHEHSAGTELPGVAVVGGRDGLDAVRQRRGRGRERGAGDARREHHAARPPLARGR